MKKTIKKIIKIVLIPFILKDFFLFNKKSNDRFQLSFYDFYPCITDKTTETNFDRHYIYHTSWAARKLKEINPEYHVDISSSLFFSSITSAFIPIKFFDYRPADLILNNFESKHADLLNLPFEDNSINSLSCMHVLEHIGLGRYGDDVDYDGDLKAIAELKRVLSKNGNLLFVVPVGSKAKIEFNAHRIYTFDLIKEYFSDLILKEFALIPKNSGGMVFGDVALANIKKENHACGCFWFVKK